MDSSPQNPSASAAVPATSRPRMPRILPACATVPPPARPSVIWIRSRARRARTIADQPSSAATRTEPDDSTSVTCFSSRARTTPTGIAASDRSPQASDHQARGLARRAPLLLDVRTSNRCGWDRPADNSGDDDQRHEIGQRLHEHLRLVAVALDAGDERTEEAEHEREADRPPGPPAAGDQCVEPDEPAAVRHVLGKGVRVADREV